MSILQQQLAHMDTDTPGLSMFIDRGLNHIMAEVFNTEIPPLKGRQFVPTRSTTPPGAKSVTYKQYTRAGIAKWITNYGDDLPAASMWVKEFTRQIQALGASYGYTLNDLLAAAMSASTQGGAPLNLDMELALAAREAVEKKLDNAARVGDADGLSASLGLYGLLNQPNATSYAVANGAAGTATFSTKTPDEIASDLHGIAYAQVASTYEVEQPDTILLPLTQYGLVATKRMGDGSNVTIKEYVLQTNPWIKAIEGWQFLAGAGSGSTDRMVCYKRDPRKVWHEIPMEFRQEAPQLENLQVKVPCWAKSGGVICPYPLSISYGDGI